VAKVKWAKTSVAKTKFSYYLEHLCQTISPNVQSEITDIPQLFMEENQTLTI
jgi:hypothetical protein